MKTKIFILSSLLCMCGIAAQASECIGAGCETENPSQALMETSDFFETVTMPAQVPAVTQYAEPVEYVYATEIPMRQMKLYTVKPVPADNRAPVWDGTHGQYKARAYDKTVDWRDGVPIWDDSIVNYKDKDFSDWYLQPLDEIYVANMPADMQNTSDSEIKALYEQSMAEAEATRNRVEELLSPKKPDGNLWTNDETSETEITVSETFKPKAEYVAQDLTKAVEITFGYSDGCPFETRKECEIWRKKPTVRETVSPRSPKIREEKMNEFLQVAACNPEITANAPEAAPLLERYKLLMNSANACCTDGMAYSLKEAGASDGLIYKFLSDDANFYGLGARCLMMTDQELDTKYPNTATAAVVADVRNGCLCRGRQWFKAMLAPFQEAYKALPEFKDAKFYYTYTDGLGRKITVSVNNDVQNVLKQLQQCP